MIAFPSFRLMFGMIVAFAVGLWTQGLTGHLNSEERVIPSIIISLIMFGIIVLFHNLDWRKTKEVEQSS